MYVWMLASICCYGFWEVIDIDVDENNGHDCVMGSFRMSIVKMLKIIQFLRY